jgi:hypothetical protein
MDFEDINPAAVVLGLVAGLVGLIMTKRMGAVSDVGIIWKILTPIACFLASFFMVQRMGE